MANLLFMCARARNRSPTGAELFASFGHDTKAIAYDGAVASKTQADITIYYFNWADKIFVMEPYMYTFTFDLLKSMNRAIPVICLFIPDVYQKNNPALIQLLKERVNPFLVN